MTKMHAIKVKQQNYKSIALHWYNGPLTVYSILAVIILHKNFINTVYDGRVFNFYSVNSVYEHH